MPTQAKELVGIFGPSLSAAAHDGKMKKLRSEGCETHVSDMSTCALCVLRFMLLSVPVCWARLFAFSCLWLFC